MLTYIMCSCIGFFLSPYKIQDNKALLIEENQFKKNYPKTRSYLLDDKNHLDLREKGKWKNKQNWHAYVYEKNLSSFSQPKLLTQVLASKGNFSFDEKYEFYFVGGGNAGGYGITLKKPYEKKYYYMLGVLNSNVLEFYLKSISTVFRGGVYSYGKRFIEQLPIFETKNPSKQKEVEILVQKLLKNKSELLKLGDKISRERELFEERIVKNESKLNNLIYSIYNITDLEKESIEKSLK